MPTNARPRSLPKPSVFKNASTNQWVCEYFEFDEKGRPKARRKSFVRDLKRECKSATLTEQRTAALSFQASILKDREEHERLERREREQVHLTPKQLREAKAAFAIFEQIPDRSKSLVDAVMIYRDHLRLAVDSPPLDECIRIFLSRKQQAAEKGKLSEETYKTLKQRLNNLRKTFAAKHPGITIGAVTARQLIEFFEGLDVAERTLENYLADIGNFFNDASNPKDEHRFINKNPMDGVQVHYRKFNGASAVKSAPLQRSAPVILSLEAVKRVLHVAQEQRKHGMLGFAVCGLFAGMRPSEVFDLVAQSNYWERFIKLEEGIIRIDGFGKKRDQRTIVLSECALVWLKFIKAEKLPLCFHYNPNSNNVRYANFRALAFLPEGDGERLIKLRRAVKGGHKPTEDENRFASRCRKTLQTFQDVLRHTYGTHYYYACGFDKHKTIEQMGHSSEVFVEHYRGLLNSPKDAEAYFELYPAKNPT